MYDIYYMKMAIALAEKGLGLTSPNPMVGAVVVKDGKVKGKGWHRKAGEAHAEIHAIDDAGKSAKGATLYVTLEPCNHFGRTPPCTEKILEADIEKVVVAIKDPNPHVNGGGIEFLKTKGIDVYSGICEDEATKLNEAFIKYMITGLPFVMLKCASTLDGRIATRTGDSKWITSPLSRQFVHKLRHNVDAVMVGIGTVNADNPALTVRLEGFDGKDPARIILDTHLSINEDAEILKLNSQAETIMMTGRSISTEKKEAIKKKGVTIIEASETDGRVNLPDVMKKLGDLDITSVMIEGGSRVTASALSAGIVDKLFFFYAPKILGGDDGIPICKGPGPDTIDQSLKIKDLCVKRFENDVMIEGYIEK